MPVVNIQMFEGRTLEQKRKLVSAVTKAITESLDISSERVRIFLHNGNKENYAHEGILECDRK